MVRLASVGAHGILLVIWFVLGVRTARADSDPLAPARAAMDEIHYAQARDLINEVIRGGTLRPDRIVEAYRLAGMVAVVLDDRGAEDHFRRALSLDATITLPDGSAPKLTRVFERAKAVIAKRGALRVTVGEAAGIVTATIEHDTMKLAQSVALRHRRGEVTRTAASDVTLEIPPDSASIAVELRDQHGNVLVEVFADRFEQSAAVVTTRSSDLPSYRKPLPWAIGAAAALVVGAVSGYYAVTARSRLDDMVADSESYTFDEVETQRERWQRNVNITQTTFVIGGALAITSLVMLATLPATSTRGLEATLQRDSVGVAYNVRW